MPADAPVSRAADWRVAGRSAARTAAALGSAAGVTGAKQFPADLGLPGMRHGAVLRPPSHGAELVSADTTAASAVPGATVVRDGSFVGVVASSSETAALARDKIEARWSFPAWDEPEPVTPASLESWLRDHPKDGDGLFGRSQAERGDVAAALRAGPVRLDASYSAAFIAHVPMEPRSALAQWRDDGGVTVWTGTSTPFRARGELAAALGLAEELVQVVVPDYGGGFGGKHGSVVALEAARLARATGGPVRVQWTRPEEFQGSYLRPAAIIDVQRGGGGRRLTDGLGVHEPQLGRGGHRAAVPDPELAADVRAGGVAAGAGVLPGAGGDGEQLRPRVAPGRAGGGGGRGPGGVPAAAPGRRAAGGGAARGG